MEEVVNMEGKRERGGNVEEGRSEGWGEGVISKSKLNRIRKEENKPRLNVI